MIYGIELALQLMLKKLNCIEKDLIQVILKYGTLGFYLNF